MQSAQRKLCDTCQRLDVRVFLTGSNSSLEHELGTWQAVQLRSATCQLCACVAAAVNNGPASVKEQLQQSTELLIAPNAIGALHCRSRRSELPQRAFRLRLYTEEYEDAGDLFLHGDDAHIIGQPAMFHGRSVNPNQIDFNLVAAWIDECCDNHSECGSTLSQQALGITLPAESLLIDVHEQCLVTARADHRYAALSYVWGDAKQFLLKQQNEKVLRTPGSLSGLPIPLTVRDAMTLTKEIRLKYLWVDALCIVQDNDTIKARLIACMHHIYGGAAVTIVAVDGAHANSGLPGVRKGTRQLEQTFAKAAGIRLVARSSYLDRTVRLSKYNQRGWTYQESCLSNRLLYITSKGIIFRCSQAFRTEEAMFEEGLCGYEKCNDHTAYFSSSQRNLWSEYVVKTRQSSSKSNSCSCLHGKRERFLNHQLPANIPGRTLVPIDVFYTDLLACDDCLAFDQANEAEFLTYTQLVRSYTFRQVRNTSDRIPAFAGIATLLEVQFATNFIYGIPEKHLNFGLLWTPCQNSPTPCRKAGLEDVPTWSWASHEIDVGYSGDNWLTSEVDWFFLDRDNSLRAAQTLIRFGAAPMPFRADFLKPVLLSQIAQYGLLEPKGSPTPLLGEPRRLVGWCQITDCFYTRGHQLYGPGKQLVTDIVSWSDAAPVPAGDLDFHPIELLFLSRTNNQPLASTVKRLESRQVDYVSLRHTINVLVIHRVGNIAKRLATSYLKDVELWESVPKTWMLIKLM